MKAKNKNLNQVSAQSGWHFLNPITGRARYLLFTADK